MKYVYLLQSIEHPAQYYLGITNNFQQRLKKHNEGGSPHTSKYTPWRIVTAIRFSNEESAQGY